MKRIIYIMTLFMLCFMLMCPLSISAEEGVEAPDETLETGESVGVDTDVDSVTNETTEAPENANLFTRLYEAFTNNRSEIFTLGGSGILFVLSMLLKKDFGTSSKALSSTLSTMLSKTDMSAERQEAIVGGLNEMIDGYEQIKEQSDYVREKMSEFNESVKPVVDTNKELET